MNKTAAREWLAKAWHHLSAGRILYEANHYTDTIKLFSDVCAKLGIDVETVKIT
jgi:hypothetical protein